jgi:hypothetical protein
VRLLAAIALPLKIKGATINPVNVSIANAGELNGFTVHFSGARL